MILTVAIAWALSEPEEVVEVVVDVPDEAATTEVEADDAREVPGASGDVVRVVESLPGVGRSTAGSGQLVVWGAAPADTRIYVDGVPIPRLYHEGGLRSVVQPALVDAVELAPGGYGADYGRGLAGLVRITTRMPDATRTSGSLGADVLDASALVAVPVGKRKRVQLAAAARMSWLDLWVRPIVGPDAAAFVPIPRYGDGQLRLAYAGSRDRVDVVGLVASDRSQRGVPNPDPALTIADRRALDFQRFYATWMRSTARGSELTVTPFVGYTRSRQASRFGSVATSIDSDTVLAGLRANHAVFPTRWLRIDLGIDATVEQTALQRRGALALPPREGDVRVFGQPPPDRIGADEWYVTLIGVAPYVQVELAPWEGKLRIVPGVRLDPYARSVSRRNPKDANIPRAGLFAHDFAVEPRLAVIGQPLERLQLRAAAGLHRQQPSSEDLSAAFGTPTLPASRALHTLVGSNVRIVGSLSLDVTGFFTRSRLLAMRSPVDSPLRSHALEPSGSGRAYGMQVLLRQPLFRGLLGWVAYTLMRSERRDREDAPVRLSDYDQTHLLTAALAYAFPRGWDVGLRMRYATGFPRTPVVGAFYDSLHDRFQPLFGEHNSIRLPAFAQLDLRLAKTFDIFGTSLETFVEVLNVWNRANAEEFVYSPDYTRRGTIRGLPILPTFGARWDF